MGVSSMSRPAHGGEVRFANRRVAGRDLAARVVALDLREPVVLGLPRGGVPVAYEIAAALGAPLDVIVVRKLGVPAQPELAMGAIGEDGVRVLNDDVLAQMRVDRAALAAVERAEHQELKRRVARYRGDRARVAVKDRDAIVVDDGIATGATVRAACQVVRAQGASRVVVAAPVAPPHSIATLLDVADDVVVVSAPGSLRAIGEHYRDFTPTSDAEVVELLRGA
jgi:putative phosphoribosyl transferase